MGFLNDFSKAAYTSARVARDLNALSRGPKATGDRIVRKAAGRAANGLLARMLNKVLGK